MTSRFLDPQAVGSRRRYETSPSPEKIHPLKRLASCAARILPPQWRFSVLGLPARVAEPENPPSNLAEDIRTIENGIACQNGGHLNARGQYLPSLTLGEGSFIESRFLKKQRCFPSIRKVGGTVLSLASDGDLNYYRWLMETLPRMRYVSDVRSFDWIYSRQDAPFHGRTLSLMGCDPRRALASRDIPYIQGRITVPKFVDEAEEWVPSWLRDRFLPLASKPAQAPGKRLFISRSLASGRRIVHEETLLAELSEWNVQVVRLEEYDWLEQIAIMRDAEIVVAPHGAGLANTVFCRPGTAIVELIAPDYPFSFYPAISRQLRLDHHIVECAPAEPKKLHRSDLKADWQGLKRIFSDIFG